MEISRSRSPGFADDLLRDFRPELDMRMFNARVKQVVVTTHFTVPQLCMLNIRRFIKISPSCPSFMGLSARVIPKASVLHSKLKSLRLGVSR